jgi:hypothetical protein
VHQGGDYLVATAYLGRAEGAVRDIDGQSFSSPPPRSHPDWHYYYPRDVEWYVAGPNLENINTIKNHIMSDGVIGTCLCSSSSYIQGTIHYQPPGSSADPNHAVAIVGWDDNKVTQAPQNGAWLCKNSWGASWGENGYFWISYYDKHCCQNPTMGAISYQDVEYMTFDNVYYHDYHGWRDTKTDVTEAFNAFIASKASHEKIIALSFYTARHDVDYTARVYDRFEGGQLLDELASQTGTIDYTGFHTVDLDTPVSVTFGDDFYVYLELSAGGHAYDRTSDVPVLLGSSYRVIVESSAQPGESYYRDGGTWEDLYYFNDTANFCLKAITVEELPLYMEFPQGLPDGGVYPPGPDTEMTVEISNGLENYVPGSGMLHYRFDSNDPYSTVPLTALDGDLYEGVLPNTQPGDEPEFYFSIQGDGGSTVYAPFDAPANFYSFDVCFIELVMEDDFETNQGWTVENQAVQTGAWERADPAGTDAQPENDHTASGTHCYVTGRLGGSIGNDDLDGGPTRLISPTLDLSGGDALLSYYLWFYHSDYGTQQPLQIHLSDNNGSTWKKVGDVLHNPAWTLHSVRVSDHVNPTSQVKIRFTANDNPNDDVVEALVDDFMVERYVFDPALWADDYSIPVSAAKTITFSLDAGAGHAARPYLLLGSLSGTEPGHGLPGGGTLPLNWDYFSDLIMVLLNTYVFQDFLGNLDGSGTAAAVLNAPGPLDPVLIGETAHFAFTLGSPFDFTSNPIPVTFDP